MTAAISNKKCIYVVKLQLILYLSSKSRSSGTPRKLKWFIAEIEVHMLPHATYNERQSNRERCFIYIYLVATIIVLISINLHFFLSQWITLISNKLSSSSSSTPPPFFKVFTITYPKQTMLLGYVVLQLFYSYKLWYVMILPVFCVLLQ